MLAADHYFAVSDQALAVDAAQGVLANDADSPLATPSAQLLQGPRHGALQLAADGSFSYLPETGYRGTDQFTYQSFDGDQPIGEFPVAIDVLPYGLIISELLAANDEGLGTRVRSSADEPFLGRATPQDWLEIHNFSSAGVDLGGFHLTDDPQLPRKWQLPADTIVPAGGYLVVFASGQDIVDPVLDETGRLHTNFRLGSNGEYMALTDPAGQLVHSFAPGYPQQYGDISYGLEAGQPRYFDAPTPGEANVGGFLGFVPPVAVRVPHGFFDAAFVLLMSSADPQARLRYTSDGSAPTETNGLDYTQALTVDHTTILRVAAFREGYRPSPVETRTYLFLDDVLVQSPDGTAPPGWPAGGSRVKGQLFDYGMDPDIVDSPVWGPQMRAALTQIPSLSLVTDLDNLINAETGIYVNANQSGRQWERPGSLELLYPDGTSGFQSGTGIRIRGGFSRTGANPKHSFRLFFRREYGNGSLQYPLFGDEGVDRFQHIDLRTAQNNSWNNVSSTSRRNTILRDIFSRDTQRAMGQPYERGRYYHLYLNGQYWGIYQTDERPEADYGVSYFGGYEEDYDVLNANEVTDGNTDKWLEFWQLAKNGFETDAKYYAAQGKNPDGSDNPQLERHLNVDNVLDYMILIYFTGNTDAPVTSSGVNNFFALRNRKLRDGWIFVAHDSESSMLTVNLNNVRTIRVGEQPQHFNPQWLHQQLMAHPDYRLRFADRLHKYLDNGGLLSTEATTARLLARAAEFDTAIIAESARWGDLQRRTQYTKEDWQKEVDWLTNEFFVQRGEVLVRQLNELNLLPTIAPPVFNQHGGQVPGEFGLRITSSVGTIYYSTDGRDPRLPGGAIRPDASVFTPGESVTLTADATVMARVWDGQQWSALTEARFLVGVAAAPTGLRISEVHYHPAPPTAAEVDAGFADADAFEFIELVNTSASAIDLTGVRLANQANGAAPGGVAFDFTRHGVDRMVPGERIVIVEDGNAFRLRYGPDVPVVGQWSGGLNNDGERLTLLWNDAILQQFTYEASWYPETRGGGSSLEIIDASDPRLDRWNEREAWRPSVPPGGTPARAPEIAGDVNQDRRFDEADLLAVLQAGQFEDNVPGNSTYASGDWNSDGDFTTADLVYAFQFGLFQP
jgi:hypothetical protein